MTDRSNRTRLLGALVLATACALVWSGAATAQQSETPSELWQEYPLDPEPGSPEPTEDAPQAPSSRSGGEPVGDGGDRAAAPDEEPFPLVQIVVALSLLLLGVLHGVSVLARRSGVPERLRERIGAVRDGSPLSPRRPVYAARRSRTEFLAQGTEPRSNLSPSAGGGEERAEVAGKRAEVAGEHAEVAAERAEVAGKPAKPPKPKVPPAAPKKPSAQKPPPAKPARPAKPVRRAKPVPAAKRVPAAKPTPAKPAQAAKPVPAAKPAEAAKRPKPAWPANSKPPTPEKPRAEREPAPRAERQPSSEQPRPVVADAGRERTLTCSIYGWRDGPVADFYALATGLQGRAWVVERSPRFEWLAGDFPLEAREAHAALVEALVTAGWRLVGTEGAWYRQRFELPFVGEGP
jgi:hypothetical protein